MASFETERLIMKTNLTTSNGTLLFPNESSDEIDVFNLKERSIEDGGFACYDKNNEDVLICCIGFQPKTEPIELSYRIEKTENYKKGYMREAIFACIKWLFSNTNITHVFARPNGSPSRKVLEYAGFERNDNSSQPWYILTRCKFFNEKQG